MTISDLSLKIIALSFIRGFIDDESGGGGGRSEEG